MPSATNASEMPTSGLDLPPFEDLLVQLSASFEMMKAQNDELRLVNSRLREEKSPLGETCDQSLEAPNVVPPPLENEDNRNLDDAGLLARAQELEAQLLFAQRELSAIRLEVELNEPLDDPGLPALETAGLEIALLPEAVTENVEAIDGQLAICRSDVLALPAADDGWMQAGSPREIAVQNQALRAQRSVLQAFNEFLSLHGVEVTAQSQRFYEQLQFNHAVTQELATQSYNLASENKQLQAQLAQSGTGEKKSVSVAAANAITTSPAGVEVGVQAQLAQNALNEINNELKETADKQKNIAENLQKELDGFHELKDQLEAQLAMASIETGMQAITCEAEIDGGVKACEPTESSAIAVLPNMVPDSDGECDQQNGQEHCSSMRAGNGDAADEERKIKYSLGLETTGTVEGNSERQASNESDRTPEPWAAPRPPCSFKAVVTGPVFESTLALLILANSLIMAAEAQYTGIDIGYHPVKYPGSIRSAANAWPGVRKWFDYLEFGFGCAFTFEVIMKIIALRTDFCKSTWNLFDFIVVGVWAIKASEIFTGLEDVMNPNLLRVVRLLRLVRIARLLKTIQMFDSLHVIIGSVINSMAILFWACVLIFVLQFAVALFLGSMLEGFLKDTDVNSEESLKQARGVYAYFGTFSRSFLTMFELTLGNWVVVTRLLAEEVHEGWAAFLVFYKIIVGFAVLKVISAVFIHETLKIAQTDDELMVTQMERDKKRYSAQMQGLFAETDTSGDGYIDRAEWKELLRNPRMRTWLQAMDIEPSMRLFDLLAESSEDSDGSIKLGPEQIARGLGRLKGPARNVDVISLNRHVLEALVQISGELDVVAALVRRKSACK